MPIVSVLQSLSSIGVTVAVTSWMPWLTVFFSGLFFHDGGTIRLGFVGVGQHSREELVRTLMRLAVTGQLLEVDRKYRLPDLSS